MSSLSNEAETLDDLLVAYALGALEPTELREVAALLRERPELRQRVAELQSIAAQLPYGLPAAEPAPDLRARVIARATGMEQAHATPPAQKVGWFRSWGLSALLGGLAALLLIATIVLGGQLGRQQQQFAEQSQTIAQQQQQIAQQQQLAALLAAPGAQIASINAPTGNATLVRAPSSGAAVSAKLPPLPADRTYQVWLIAGESQPPTSAGLLSVAADGSAVLILPDAQPTLHEAAVFAITVEPSGGSPGPTTKPLVSGKFGPS